jgi:toxin CptA
MLRVPLKPSRYLALTLTAAHACAAIVLIPLELALWSTLALLTLIVASFAYALRRHALLRSAGSFIVVEFRQHDCVAVQTRDGRWHEARVLPTTCVSPLLTVLNLRVPRRVFARHVVLARDSANNEDYRQVRVWLRWAYRTER